MLAGLPIEYVLVWSYFIHSVGVSLPNHHGSAFFYVVAFVKLLVIGARVGPTLEGRFFPDTMVTVGKGIPSLTAASEPCVSLSISHGSSVHEPLSSGGTLLG